MIPSTPEYTYKKVLLERIGEVQVHAVVFEIVGDAILCGCPLNEIEAYSI